MSLSWRFSVPADLPALAALNAQLIQDEGHRNPMTVRELEARVATWLRSGYRAVLFEDADRVVAYALYRSSDDVGQETAHDIMGNTAAQAFWRAVGFADYALTLEWTTQVLIDAVRTFPLGFDALLAESRADGQSATRRTS